MYACLNNNIKTSLYSVMLLCATFIDSVPASTSSINQSFVLGSISSERRDSPILKFSVESSATCKYDNSTHHE